MRFEMSLLSCDDEIGLGRFFRFSQPRARARARARDTERDGWEGRARVADSRFPRERRFCFRLAW